MHPNVVPPDRHTPPCHTPPTHSIVAISFGRFSLRIVAASVSSPTVLAMSPSPLSPCAGLLRPLTAWCLDTFGEGPPMLIGVTLHRSSVTFHPIELDDDDPVADLAGLAAPDPWDVLVILAPATELGGGRLEGIIAHAIDRFGSSATELDEASGRRRSLNAVGGPLHEAGLALFGRCA